MCVDAPDTSGMDKMAESSAELGRESLDWFKAEAARTQGQRDTAAANADLIAKANLETMASQNALAKDYDEYNKTTFRPLEQGIVADAQGYDTADRRQAAADSATADVRGALGRATGSTMRTAARMGYTPTMNADRLALGAAMAEAGAATNARRTVESTGRALKMDAASLGRGLPSAQATAIQTGIGAGQGSLQAGQAGSSASMGAAQLMGQGFSSGLQGYGQAGGLYGQSAQMHQKADMFNASVIGDVAGTAAGMFMKPPGIPSDENIKTGTGKVLQGKKARMRMEKTQVDEGWKYDPAKGGPADGQTHDGPMAQEVRRTMGERAAPGGKQIDVATMLGNLVAAVGDISKDVRQLQRVRMA